MNTHAQELERYRRAERVLPLGVSSGFRTCEPCPHDERDADRTLSAFEEICRELE